MTPTHHCIAILNTTPDSFSDGGQLATLDAAMAKAQEAINAGASFLEVGGESTRPGATEVPETEELRRTLPLLQALHTTFPTTPLIIDTRKANVAHAALNAGASWVNDVSGLRYQGAALLQTTLAHSAGLILMHSIGTPHTMQTLAPNAYPKSSSGSNSGGLSPSIFKSLSRLAQKTLQAGLPPHQLLLDPGFGFGKTKAHNLELLHNLGTLQTQLGFPLVMGASRKSFLALHNEAPHQREPQAIAAHTLAYQQGIRYFRIHNVPLHQQALHFLQQTNPL